MNEDSTPSRSKKDTLADFLARSTLRGSGLKIERSKETAKPLDFENTPAPPLNPWRKSRR